MSAYHIFLNAASFVMRTGQSIEWEDVIKKEARGTNDDDLGEVQDIGQTYVVTQKGTINREKFTFDIQL